MVWVEPKEERKFDRVKAMCEADEIREDIAIAERGDPKALETLRLLAGVYVASRCPAGIVIDIMRKAVVDFEKKIDEHKEGG